MKKDNTDSSYTALYQYCLQCLNPLPKAVYYNKEMLIAHCAECNIWWVWTPHHNMIPSNEFNFDIQKQFEETC